MKRLNIIIALLLAYLIACSQHTPSKKVGGNCEGCEAIHESPVPFEKLTEFCWLPDWKEEGTQLAVNGIVYNPDKTPAAGVIIYIYHTDQTGHYSMKGNETGWGKRHGYIRGWMKTNEKGEYKFFTLRPAPYPGGNNPAHIHVTIKEPGKNEYWIDEYVFDDDRSLTTTMRSEMQNRGGNGILFFSPNYAGKKLLKAERNIYLGKNIPDYE
jgi:protocatechuate 3,4-dioxygenase, beta subunit